MSYTLAMDANHLLVANFALDVPQWTIAAASSPVRAVTRSLD